MSMRAKLRPAVHRSRYRLDNPDLRQARTLVRRLEQAPLDVLYLHESVSMFVSPQDSDRRTLAQMVADGLGPGVRFHACGDAGYHPRLYSAYLGLVRRSGQNPVVVHPIWPRGTFTPWAEHPHYARDAATRIIQRASVRPGRPKPIWAPITPANDRLMAVLDAKSFRTALGTRPVGEYRLPLKHPEEHGLDRADWSRLAYAYHQTGIVRPDSPYLSAYTDLARDLAELGCPVVTYQTPIPVEGAVAEFGEPAATTISHNLDLLERAHAAGGANVIALGGGLGYPLTSFIDHTDATEHINEAGRLPLAARIIEAVRVQLESRQPSRTDTLYTTSR